jgi:hypothetical protein
MKKLLFLVVVLSSCAPVYVPNLRNSPMFQKQGEFQGSFQIGNGLEAQGGVALTNHLGLIANYAYINNTETEESSDYHRHRLAEAGLGYFSNSEDMIFEFYAGYGKGEGSSYESFYFSGSQAIQATGKYERYFFQPAFGFNKKVFHFSFSTRFSVVDFLEFSDGTTTFQDNRDPIVFFEPAALGRVNMMNNHMFYTFQTGFSTAIGQEKYFDHRGLQFGMGFGFRLGGKKEGEDTVK